jgi:hypothetical protein
MSAFVIIWIEAVKTLELRAKLVRQHTYLAG